MKQASLVGRLDNWVKAPAVAGFIVVALSLCTIFNEAQPAFAQLPPVNMGKFIHQPGDNQYSDSTQASRHGGGPARGCQIIRRAVPQQPRGPVGWQPVHKIRPDISIQAIVCDEPIPPAGFPPISDALELPGIRGGGSFTSGIPSRIPSYGGGAGGVAPGLGGPSKASEMHQGYKNMAPGAFKQGSKTGKGAVEMYASGDGAAKSSKGGRGRGRGGGDGGSRGDDSSAQGQLRRMGREPRLSDNGGNASPEAPQAVEVNQSTTQDLSLPDDQSQTTGQNKSPNQAGRALKRVEQQMMQRMMGSGLNMLRMPTGH